MGEKVNLVNPAYETAISLGKLLEEKHICASEDNQSKYSFYVSDAEEKFKKFANSIMPFQTDLIEQINIEEY